MKKAILGLLCSSFLFPLVGFAYEDGIYEVMNGTAKTVKYGDIEITVQMNDLSGYYYWGINDSFDRRCNVTVPQNYKDKIKNGKENNDARGGGDDNYKNGYDSGNNRKNRQGPCEDGRHVPSKRERSDLLKARCLGGDNECDESKISYISNGLISRIHMDQKGMIEGKFKNDFSIFGENARYWTSSPRNVSNSYTTAWSAFPPIAPEWDASRSSCWNVRCFKDEPTYEGKKESKEIVTSKVNKDTDFIPSCLDVVFKNGDSMCIGLELNTKETNTSYSKNVRGEHIYTKILTPIYTNIIDKYLTKNYDPTCKFTIQEMEGFPRESCNQKNRLLNRDISYMSGDRMRFKPEKKTLVIKYPETQTINIEVSIANNGQFRHLPFHGRFEQSTGDYDIVYFEPKDTYYQGNDLFGIKDEYIKIIEVLYSSNDKDRQNITNSWDDYIIPGFSEDKSVYNTSIINIVSENKRYDFIRELYVKKAGFYKITYKYLTHERKEGTSYVTFNAPVVTTKFKNGKNDEGNKNNEMETNKQNNQEAHIDYNKTQNNHNHEFNDAYDFAYKNGITTANNINQADMNGGLTRIAMAKMLSQYAINILGKSPDTSKTPNFSDVNMQLDASYNNGVTLAYQLGIMGMGLNKFSPYDTVTRAEFGTALSRMLFGLSDGSDNYYSTHLSKLKSEGIINNDNPNLKEQRGYVMLMLMRSAK